MSMKYKIHNQEGLYFVSFAFSCLSVLLVTPPPRWRENVARASSLPRSCAGIVNV